ncbi:MAG: hypothetical protein ACI9BK_000887 [Acidimicrobiales bacterium]|jgi:hypothetical protein
MTWRPLLWVTGSNPNPETSSSLQPNNETNAAISGRVKPGMPSFSVAEFRYSLANTMVNADWVMVPIHDKREDDLLPPSRYWPYPRFGLASDRAPGIGPVLILEQALVKLAGRMTR